MSQSKQQWLIDLIPAEFTDIDQLMEIVVYNALIHFLENDDGLESLEAQTVSEYHSEEKRRHYRQVYSDMLSAYNWAKSREDLIAVILESPDREINMAEFNQTDTKHLMNVIKHRSHLWT